MSTEPPVANFVDGTFHNPGETHPVFFEVGAPIRFTVVVGDKSFAYTEVYFGLYTKTAPLKIWRRVNPDTDESPDDACSDRSISDRESHVNAVFTIKPTYTPGRYTLSLRGGHRFKGSSRKGDKATLEFFVGRPENVACCSRAFGARVPSADEPYVATAEVTIDKKQDEVFHIGDKVGFSVRPLKGDLEDGYVRVVKVGSTLQSALETSYLHDNNGTFSATRGAVSGGALVIDTPHSGELLYRNEGEPDLKLLARIRKDFSRIDSYSNLRDDEREILRGAFMSKYVKDKHRYVASDVLNVVGQGIGFLASGTHAAAKIVPSVAWQGAKSISSEAASNRSVRRNLVNTVAGEGAANALVGIQNGIDRLTGSAPEEGSALTKIGNSLARASVNTVTKETGRLRDRLDEGRETGATGADYLASQFGWDEEQRLVERLANEPLFELWFLRKVCGKKYILWRSLPFLLRKNEERPVVEAESTVGDVESSAVVEEEGGAAMGVEASMERAP